MSISRVCCALLLPLWAAVSFSQDLPVTDLSLDSLLAVPVSTAAKYKQTAAEAPASISVITSSDLERYHYRTLAEVLNRVRGFYISNDRNYSYAGIRGFSRPTDNNDRILLLVDGHTFNENVYGSALIGTEFGIPLEAIERIEIVRGPGSALYGAGAMFGVVNVITKDFHSLNGVRVSGSLGTSGYRDASVLFGKAIGGSGGVFVSANFGREDGTTDLYFPEYDTDSTNHGVASNNDWDTHYGITAKITLPHLVIQSGFTHRDKGIPTASFFTVFNDSRAKTHDAHQFADMVYTVPLRGPVQVSLRLYGDRYDYSGVYPYGFLSTDQSTGLWWGSEARLQWDVASNDRLVIGSEYQDNTRSDYAVQLGGEEIFNQNKPFSVVSLYAQNEFQWLEDLSITAGLRYDHHSTCGSTVSPRLAVNWNAFDGGVVKFLVGQAFRMPNFYELYYIDPLSSFKANPSLSPEHITTWELVLEQRLASRLQGSVSVYKYSMTGLVDQVLDPVDSMFHFSNRGTTTARGVEVELDYRPHASLHCYGIASAQIAEDGTTKIELTNSPGWLFRAGASYAICDGLDASLEASHDGRRITVYRTASPAFTLAHAKVNYTPLPGLLKLSAGVRNLFDAHYGVPGGYEHLQPVLPQAGREIVVKVECTL